MKVIFSEHVEVFSGSDKDSRQRVYVQAGVVGHYAPKEGVLCVDLNSWATVGDLTPFQKPPAARRVLESTKFDAEAAAIRRTVTLMDEWTREVTEWAKIHGPTLCRDPSNPVM